MLPRALPILAPLARLLRAALALRGRVARSRHALAADEVLRLPGGRGRWVRVEAGRAVITREGDPADHVLEAGATLAIPDGGLALAWALDPCRLEVRTWSRGAAAEARPGGSAAPDPGPGARFPLEKGLRP